MSPKKSTKAQLEQEYWDTRWAIASKHPWSFLRDFVNTFDEHEEDPTLALDKPFPNKVLYRILARAWTDLNIVFIEKSRQVMMTWIMASLYLWMVMFRPGTRIFLQSKKDEDAQAIIDRARHIYLRLVKMNLPNLPKARKVGDSYGTTTKFEFPELKSELRAIPQGPDQVRSYTWSGGLSDESEFQPDFEDAYGAAAPAFDQNSKYMAVSTVNGENICYYILYGIDPITGEKTGDFLRDSRRVTPTRFVPPDHLNNDEKRLHTEKAILALSDEEFDSIPFEELVAECPGIDYWQTASGGHSMRVHYSADPDKDPSTTWGKIWYDKAFRRMNNPRKWDREMELRRNVYSGRPVIANWSHSIFVQDFEYDSEYAMLLSHDFGTILCGTLFAQYVRIKDFNAFQLRFIDELVLRGLASNTPNLAIDTVDVLKAKYPRTWANGNIRAFCDPNGSRRTDTVADVSLNTSLSIMNLHGIFPDSRKFPVKESTENMETAFCKILPNGEPAVVVHPRCTYLISCLEGGLHYPPPKPGKLIPGGKDGHYEKDGIFDHGGDMARYLINNIFTDFAFADKPEPSHRFSSQYRYRKYTGERIRVNRTKVLRGGAHAVRSELN